MQELIKHALTTNEPNSSTYIQTQMDLLITHRESYHFIISKIYILNNNCYCSKLSVALEVAVLYGRRGKWQSMCKRGEIPMGVRLQSEKINYFSEA